MTAAANLARIGALPLVERIAKEHGVTLEQVTRRGRTAAVARARRHAWTVLRHTFGYSYPELGALWGGYDHTTILSGVRKYERELADAFGQ